MHRELKNQTLHLQNVIGHVQNGKIPVNCSHQEVCTTNQILVNEFGIQGRTVGSMLRWDQTFGTNESQCIPFSTEKRNEIEIPFVTTNFNLHPQFPYRERILYSGFLSPPHNSSPLTQYLNHFSKAIVKMLKEVNQSPAADKYLLQASLDGRNGENCERAYPTCRQLEKGKHSLSQLVSPEQVTAIVLRKNPRLIPSSNWTCRPSYCHNEYIFMQLTGTYLHTHTDYSGEMSVNE